jgi:hypothetical protein
MASSSLWQRFQRYFLEYRELGFFLDMGRMKVPDDPTNIFFFDNTDPERFDRRFERIGEGFQQTLVMVVDPEEVFHFITAFGEQRSTNQNCGHGGTCGRSVFALESK